MASKLTGGKAADEAAERRAFYAYPIGRTFWYKPSESKLQAKFYQRLERHPVYSDQVVLAQQAQEAQWATEREERARALAANLATAEAEYQVAKKAAEQARLREIRRKGGVRLGMTPKQVRASAWGAPHSVNRTTSRSGVYEQWVYGNGGYLYFENGELVTIQN